MFIMFDPDLNILNISNSVFSIYLLDDEVCGQDISDYEKVQVGKDQEKAQSERDSHSKNQGGKKPN